jgi:hypothetical protein
MGKANPVTCKKSPIELRATDVAWDQPLRLVGLGAKP